MTFRPRLLLGFGALTVAGALESIRDESHELGTSLVLLALSVVAFLASRRSGAPSDTAERTLKVSALLSCLASCVLITWSVVLAVRVPRVLSVDVANRTVHEKGATYLLERDDQFQVPDGRRWTVTKDGSQVGFVVIIGKNVIGEPIEVRDSWAAAILADASIR